MDRDSIMPIGRHKGKRLGEVPAGWLLWWFDKDGNKDADRPLSNYIRSKEGSLRKQKAEEDRLFFAQRAQQRRAQVEYDNK